MSVRQPEEVDMESNETETPTETETETETSKTNIPPAPTPEEPDIASAEEGILNEHITEKKPGK